MAPTNRIAAGAAQTFVRQWGSTRSPPPKKVPLLLGIQNGPLLQKTSNLTGKYAQFTGITW